MKKQFRNFFSEQNQINYWEEVYDRNDFFGDVYRRRMGYALSCVSDAKLSLNSSILEVGCGNGLFSNQIAKKGYKIFGLDFSQGMVQKASNICNNKEKHRVKFLQGDVEFLPLQDSSIDVIVCLGVVAYLKSEDKALHELARVLKPGGLLIISIVNKARLADRLDLPIFFLHLIKRIFYVITSYWKKGVNNNKMVVLKTYLIPEFQKSLELAGFTTLERQMLPWSLVTFFGKELHFLKIAEKITMLFEHSSNIPFVGSFGGMCVFRVQKKSITTNVLRN